MIEFLSFFFITKRVRLYPDVNTKDLNCSERVRIIPNTSVINVSVKILEFDSAPKVVLVVVHEF